MITTELVLADAMISVSGINLFLKYCHFLKVPALAISPYHVKSCLIPTPLKQLAEAIQSGFPNIKEANADDLASLCAEFGFYDVRDAIAKFVSGDNDLDGIHPSHPQKIHRRFSLNSTP
jgi:hypothetical protein